MADLRWTGAATAVAQVDTYTPGGTIEVGDIFTLTITGWDGTSKAISFTATATTVANVTAGLTAAWNASTHALCTPITAADNTTNMTLTADTAGEAFSVTQTTTESGGGAADAQTFAKASTTASAGPKHWDSVGNWDTGALPGGAASQDVYIENDDTEIIYGLDQSAIANTLTSLNIGRSFTGKIGYDGASGFSGTYLQIKASAVNIGYSYANTSGNGSSRIMINTGSTESAITVEGSANSLDTSKQSIRLLADSATTTLGVLKGNVGVAQQPGETARIGTISLSYNTSKEADANVVVGAGVTLTTMNKNSGICYLGCAATTVNHDAGTLYTFGSGAITTVNQEGGTFYSNSSGTITALNVISGTADFTKSLKARTVTTAKIDATGSIVYDPSILTLTNQIQAYDTSGNLKITAAIP